MDYRILIRIERENQDVICYQKKSIDKNKKLPYIENMLKISNKGILGMKYALLNINR